MYVCMCVLQGHECLAVLCKHINALRFARGQSVYRAGALPPFPLTVARHLRSCDIASAGKFGTEMYFIMSGEVEVTDANAERLGFLGQGSFFGETPLMECVQAGKGGDGTSIRSRSILVVAEAEIAQLQPEDVLRTMDHYPELRIRLKMFNSIGKRLSTKGRRRFEMRMIKKEMEAIKERATMPSEEFNSDELMQTLYQGSSAGSASSSSDVQLTARVLLSQCGGNVQEAALVLKREAMAQVNITCDQLMETNK
jgi:CRP-like cAMP-binding protein